MTGDGAPVTMEAQSDYYGSGSRKLVGSYYWEFEDEGSKTFSVTATKGNETKTVQVTAKYEIGKPVLNITACPTEVTKKNITISGTLTDANYSASLTVNGKSVSSDYSDRWSKSFTLKEGANKFVFVAINAQGKTEMQEKTAVLTSSAPEIMFYNSPEKVQSPTVTIEGSVQSENGSARLYMNDQALSLSYNGDFSKNRHIDGGREYVFMPRGKFQRQRGHRDQDHYLR